MRYVMTGLMAAVVGLSASVAAAQEAAPAQPPAEAVAPEPVPDRFTTEQLQPMLTQGGSDCEIANKTQINVTETRAYYEVSCPDGHGEVIAIVLPQTETSAVSVVPCTSAVRTFNYTCSLTTVEANQAWFDQRVSSFSQLASSRGVDCQVSGFIPFPTRDSMRVSEISCANRPESAVAFNGPGVSEVMHCARAWADGYRCGTDKATWTAATTADLHKVRPGASSCIVADMQVLGRSSTTAYLEVTCTDGLLGYVIGYPRGNPAPSDATACAMASGIGGGCRMPGNASSGVS